MSLEIGDEFEVQLDRVAHGGHFVGRVNGQVVFVRHGAPSERVRAVVTEVGKGGRLAFATTLEVLKAHPNRVTPPCRFAGECGGCDFQHLELAYQRELKSQVLKEQLERLGKLEDLSHLDLTIYPFTENETGLGWRSRMRYAVDTNGRIGFRKHDSAEVIAISECKIAQPDIAEGEEVFRPWAANSEVIAVRTSQGHRVVHSALAPAEVVNEKVDKFEYQVSTTGFWQAHKQAPIKFVEQVLEFLGDLESKHVLDLYAGVGLFAVPLADAVGAGGRVEAVEGFADAGRLLRRNLRPWQQRAFSYTSDVAKWLRTSSTKKVDAVVLDPPRAGANRQVLEQISRLRPATLVYVACDPAALARDTEILGKLGYELKEIKAFDAFPMTHHFETIAKFVPAKMPR